MVTVIDEVDVQSAELITQFNCVVPEALSDNEIVEFGKVGLFIVTPALFAPLTTHLPVSPEFVGAFAESP